MRWALLLALACSIAACRRSPPPPPEPAAPGPAERAAAPAAPAEPATPTAAHEPAAAPETPPPAAAAEPAPAPEALPAARDPLPPAAPALAANDEPDDRVYSWVDEQGGLHYGMADEVPPGLRKSARPVDAGVTVVPQAAQAASPAPRTAPPARNAPPVGREQPAARPPGEEPLLDAQGLPIPGTMKDTAATRASKAAGETNIDPAAVERRRQEDLQRMNCKEKDGVWICG